MDEEEDKLRAQEAKSSFHQEANLRLHAQLATVTAELKALKEKGKAKKGDIPAEDPDDQEGAGDQAKSGELPPSRHPHHDADIAVRMTKLDLPSPLTPQPYHPSQARVKAVRNIPRWPSSPRLLHPKPNRPNTLVSLLAAGCTQAHVRG